MKKHRHNDHTSKIFKLGGNSLLHWVEIVLGCTVLIAVFVAALFQVAHFIFADWSSMDTFLELLKAVLHLAIGVEVARLLFSYCLDTIIELAVFLVARKLLLLDEDFISLIIGVLAIVLLFAARHFFVHDDNEHQA